MRHPEPEVCPCGAISQPDGSVRWRVWSPQAKSLQLVLYQRDAGQRTLEMEPEPGGYFVRRERGIAEGQRYSFRIDGGPARPDPASRWQPDGVHRPSAVLLPEQFVWAEGGWTSIPREQLVIYELHVGTFTPEGTFDAVIPRLAALAELGVTAIELMPVAQFPGTRGWGYDGVHPYAVQNSYGGPHGLQRLINACHRLRLAIILDVVYNHLGPEGNYLAEFGPYFTDRYRTPWGAAMNFDGRGSDPVRAFVLDNVRQWIRDYRVDGLRLDAVHAIYDFSARHILREIKEAADDESRRLGRPVHVIAESNLNDVRLLDPPERGGYGLDAQWSDDFHHCVHTLLTGENTGYYADFGRPEQLVKALNETFVYDGRCSVFRGRRHGAPAGDHPGDRFLVSIQTHDQVGNRARGDRFGTLLSPSQQRLAAGLLLLAPHLPLLFMGEEYGETRPFPFFCSFLDPQLADAVRNGRRAEFAEFRWQGEIPDPQDEATFQSAKLTWSWPEDSVHAGLRRLYGDLFAARRRWPALCDFHHRRAELLGSSARRVLRLERGGSNVHFKSESSNSRSEISHLRSEMSHLRSEISHLRSELLDWRSDTLIAYFNLTDQEQPLPEEDRGERVLLLASESARYSGKRAEDALYHSPLTTHHSLLPYEFQIFGPRAWESP
jgi:maltooligosyltrehalose trehalohydrolase